MLNLTKALNFLLVIYFFLKFEIVNTRLPSLWFVFLIGIFFLSIRIFFSMKQSEIIFLIKKNIWFFILIPILLVYKYFDYGNFRLDFMIQYLLYSLPFLIIGFYYSSNKKKLNYIVFSLLILFFLSYLFSIVNYLSNSDLSRESLEFSVFGDRENSGLLHLWPILSTLILITYGFYSLIKINNLLKISLYVIWIVLILFIFLSGYMSGIVFLLISVLAIIYYNTKRINVLRFIFLLPIIGYSFILFLAKFSFGAIKAKSEGILFLINSGFLIDENTLNIATSNRWTAIIYSFNQFIDKPFFGHGIYLEEVTGMLGKLDNYSTASGGHTFFIDIAAYMGVFSIPVYFVYINFIKNSVRILNINRNNIFYNKNIVIYSIFVSVFVSNIFNHWLLFSYFDNFIFLLAGYVCGQLFLHSKLEKSI